MDHLTAKTLQLEPLLEQTTDDTAGALVVFAGAIRNHHQKRAVSKLCYTAYEPIAAARLAELEQRSIAKFAISQCRIVHRIGELQIGDIAVYVVIRAAHRGPAFTAAKWMIDTAKETVPIWKQEFYSDGSIEYVQGLELRDID